MTIDSNLLAEWVATDGTRVVFQPDSSVYFGTVSISYSLDDPGNILNINNKTFYARLPGSSPTSIVGHWRDDQNGEEILFRTDGRYISMFDGDPLIYFGTYTATPTSLTSFEYRGMCATDGNQITLNFIFGNSQTGQYTVTKDTLVVQVSGSSITYRKVANPTLNRIAQQLRCWFPFGPRPAATS